MTSAPSFRLLPVEPTVGMFSALTSWAKDDPKLAAMMVRWMTSHFADDYRAMLAAAPVLAEATGEMIKAAASVLYLEGGDYADDGMRGARLLAEKTLNAALAIAAGQLGEKTD